MKQIASLLLGFMILIALPSCGEAQDSASATAEETTADKFLDIQELKTDSGITVWLVEDHTLPIIAMSYAFKGAGSAQDAPEDQGLTIMASSTMDEGAGEYDAQSFQKTLSDNNISVSFRSDRDNFTGYLKTLTKHKDLAFDLLHIALTEPRFEEEALDRMRASHTARIRSSLSDPEWKAARILNDVAFQGHPYAQNSGGTISGLAGVTAEKLRSKVLPRLAKDNLMIAVTGDITAEELKAAIDEAFAGLPDTAQLKEVADLTIQNAGTITVYEQDIPQTVIRATQDAIGRDDPRYYPAKIMNYILGGGGFGSRLMDVIREQRGLTYGVYTGMSEMDHLASLTLSTSTKNESVAELLSLAEQEFARMRTEPVSEDELTRAQSYLTGSLPLSLSSTDRIAGLMLSLQLEDLPANYLDSYDEKINAVTAEDILSVAKDLLKEDALAIILVGKPESITADKTVTELPNVE